MPIHSNSGSKYRLQTSVDSESVSYMFCCRIRHRDNNSPSYGIRNTIYDEKKANKKYTEKRDNKLIYGGNSSVQMHAHQLNGPTEPAKYECRTRRTYTKTTNTRHTK